MTIPTARATARRLFQSYACFHGFRRLLVIVLLVGCGAPLLCTLPNRLAAGATFEPRSTSPSDQPEEATTRGLAPVMVQTATWAGARGDSIPVKIYLPAILPPSGRSPVILFSHGLGGSRDTCAYLGRAWASHGYVSIHPQHLGSDESVWRGTLAPLRSLRAAYQRSKSGDDRVGDLRAVIARLEQEVAMETDLGLRIDPEQLALAGNDLGALAALRLAGQRHRGNAPPAMPQIKAAILLSPPAPGGADYSEIDVPCLHMTGTDDDGLVGNTRAHQRRVPFDAIDRADQFLVTFRDGDHMLFQGHLLRIRARQDAPYHRVIGQLTTDFLAGYLRGDAEARRAMLAGQSRAALGPLGRLEIKPGETSAMPGEIVAAP